MAKKLTDAEAKELNEKRKERLRAKYAKQLKTTKDKVSFTADGGLRMQPGVPLATVVPMLGLDLTKPEKFSQAEQKAIKTMYILLAGTPGQQALYIGQDPTVPPALKQLAWKLAKAGVSPVACLMKITFCSPDVPKAMSKVLFFSPFVSFFSKFFFLGCVVCSSATSAEA